MPIQKFGSLNEAGKPRRLRPGTSEYSSALRSVLWIAAQLAPPCPFPPGVYKHRSIEEAQAQWKSSTMLSRGKRSAPSTSTLSP